MEGKRLLSEKNMAAWLRSAKLHLNKPQNLNNVNGHNAKHQVWKKHSPFSPRTDCQQSGGGLIFGALFFAQTGIWHLVVTNFTMKSSVYQNILESDVRPSVQQQNLGPVWVI